MNTQKAVGLTAVLFAAVLGLALAGLVVQAGPVETAGPMAEGAVKAREKHADVQ